MRNFYQSVAYNVTGRASGLMDKDFINKIYLSDGKFHDSKVAYYDGQKTDSPTASLSTIAAKKSDNNVLGLTTADGKEKWIEVDLSDQKLYGWEGDRKVYDFTISSGKPWTPTPEGEFRVWIKLRYHTMEGGSKETGDYYKLPNVPYVMYFDAGYGIHGTYWHNNFGHPMSHGCINLRTEDAAQIFNWAGPDLGDNSVALSSDTNPGIRVVVHE